MSSGWIVVCQPLPVSSCNGRPEYSCQARFANSAEPSARAHNTKAGMVSIRYRRSSGSVLRLAPCVSEVIFVNTGSHKNGIHKKQFRSEEFPVQACSSISQASTGGLSETSLYFSPHRIAWTKAENKGFLMFIGRRDGHAKRFRP